jgi:hypothetical protein
VTPLDWIDLALVCVFLVGLYTNYLLNPHRRRQVWRSSQMRASYAAEHLHGPIGGSECAQ